MKPRRMGQAASDYVLRRTKDKVLTDLPPKMFRDADVELTPEQRAQLSTGRRRRRAAADRDGRRGHDSARLRAGAAAEADLQLRSGHRRELEVRAAGRRSGRSRRQRPQGDRLQPMGRHAGDARPRGWRHFRPLSYHGRDSPRASATACSSSFATIRGSTCMLMSYGAGGVGLNLQFADYVFLFDRWWNPAVEDQAINRAHRIGAAGPVTVTRFLGARHDRGADRPDPAREARDLRHDLQRRRTAPEPGPDAAGDLRPVPAPLPRRADRCGSVRDRRGWRRRLDEECESSTCDR